MPSGRYVQIAKVDNFIGFHVLTGNQKALILQGFFAISLLVAYLVS